LITDQQQYSSREVAQAVIEALGVQPRSRPRQPP